MVVYAATFLACFLYLAAAYPNGAPEVACETFRPRHNNHHTGQPIKAKNENDNGELDDSECPYEVIYSNKFIPGEKLNLTIRTKDSNDYFQGYILTVVEVNADGSNAESRGNFGASSKKICDNGVVTQSENHKRASEVIEWTAPSNGSKKIFEVWMTVVKSYSRYWMSCSPILLPAFDADDQSALELPVEDVELDNSTSIFKDDGEKKHHNTPKDQRSSSSMMKDVSSSSMIESEEDPDSVGQDESGNSIENSKDVSDNRSGSSLLSAEKEAKRQKYFAEGIENFDKDIKKLLVAVDKENLYNEFIKSGAFKSGAATFTGFTALVAIAVAMLALA